MKYELLTIIYSIIFITIHSEFEKVGDQDVFLSFSSLKEIKKNENEKDIMRVIYIEDNICFSFTDYHLNDGVANPSLANNFDDYMLAETYVFTNLSFESIRNSGIYFGIGFGSETMFGSTYVLLYYLGSDNWSIRDAYTDDKEHNVKFKLDQSKVQLLKKTWFSKINIKDLNYSHMFYFKWKRILNKLDNFDYLGLRDWRYTKFPTIASLGYLKQNIIQRHIVRSKFNEVRMENTIFNEANPINIANQVYFTPFKTANNDLVFSNVNNWSVPYYNICDAMKFEDQYGKQIYYDFITNGHNSMLIYDLKISSLYIRGSTYLFSTRTFKDVHTTGVYSGLIFNTSTDYNYAIITRYIANSVAKEIKNEIYDIWLDKSLIFNEKIGSRNIGNGGMNIIKGAWFEFSNETKEKRYNKYNSLWAIDWYINLEYYKNTDLDIVNYLSKDNNPLTGIHNLNSKEFIPILTDTNSINKNVVSKDGSGISSFEILKNQCITLTSSMKKLSFLNFIFYFWTIAIFLIY